MSRTVCFTERIISYWGYKYYKVLLTSECRIQSRPRTRTGLQMVKWQCMDCVRCAAALCLVLIICRLVIETQPWLLLKHREVIRPVQIYSEITGAASGKNASFNYPGFFLAWAGACSSEQGRNRRVTLHTLNRENKPSAQHCHQDHQTPLALIFSFGFFETKLVIWGEDHF